MSSINQIKLKDTQEVYDIEAKSLDPNNEYTGTRFDIKKSTGSAIIGFNYSEEGGVAAGGVVEYNNKGNLAVESLSKNVNIEAKKNIQLKPTEEIIIDSGRREAASGDNEAILKVKNDDTKEWGSLKIKSRNIDLRCHGHGGIALQPCHTDNNNFENKIKFESSRTAPLGAKTVTYDTEGGKGLEFGTFNNEHTSLFTYDYRFNKDGYVYAVTRGNPVTANGKYDYPTQSDDFKDIVDSNLGVSWEYIIKAAKVFEAIENTGTTVTDANIASLLATAFNSIYNPAPQV